MASLTFLGAAGTVTGSKHLLDLGNQRVLVDCGLFQGLKELRLRNWAALPIDASSTLSPASAENGAASSVASAGKRLSRSRVISVPLP